MPVSLSNDVKITPGVIGVEGAAVDLNGGFLTDSDLLPAGTFKSFSKASSVSTFFGAASDEYTAASIYFQGVNNSTHTPGTVWYGRFNREDVSATLVSASLADMTVAELQAVSGTLTVNVNNTGYSFSLDFSEVTSFAAAASLIQSTCVVTTTTTTDDSTSDDSTTTTSTELFTVTFDTTNSNLIIAVNATDDYATTATTLEYPSGDIADSLLLTSGHGALLGQGASAATASDFFTALKETTRNWFAVTPVFAAESDVLLDLASWVHAQSHRYCLVAWVNDTTDPYATTSGSTECVAYEIETTNSYDDVLPLYSLTGVDKAACVLGYCASLNFDTLNGRYPLKFRALDDLSADITDDDTYDALTGNGYTFYAQYGANAEDYNYFSDGSVTGDYLWLDALAGQVWLNANLQQDIITLFMTNTHIPYADRGRALVSSCMQSSLEQFSEWGGLTAGTDLDDSQIATITAVTGSDVSSTLTSQGWYLYIGAFTAAMRSARTTPEVYLWYTDGGCMQQLYMNSVEVQ